MAARSEGPHLGARAGRAGRPVRASGLRPSGHWRLVEIHRLIAGGAHPNCATLAARLEVDRRTAERDIERLRDLYGAPVEYDPRRGGYRYAAEFRLPTAQLSEGEMVALFLGYRLLRQCRGTPFEADVERALLKVRELLPATVDVDLDRVAAAISFQPEPPLGEDQGVAARFAELSRAIDQRLTVSMEYYSASRDALSRRDVDPYHLRYAGGGWYLVGYCHRRREVLLFALSRIRDLRTTDRRFLPPPDFSPEAYFGDSLTLERGQAVDVAVRFGPAAARYVRERRWHPSQRIEESEDGGLVLRLHVAGLGEVKRWVLGFGAGAEVLEPQELRAAVRGEAEGMVAKYNRWKA
jgi:predicted DNA-binding transcriptional regulator YafY